MTGVYVRGKGNYAGDVGGWGVVQPTPLSGWRGAGGRIVTAITSRHADKAGNGKTTLAVAAVQTIEVRQRFVDGIAWIRVGRMPLTERDVRRLYEDLYDQLLDGDVDGDGDGDGDVQVEHTGGDINTKDDPFLATGGNPFVEYSGLSTFPTNTTSNNTTTNNNNTRMPLTERDVRRLYEDLYD